MQGTAARDIRTGAYSDAVAADKVAASDRLQLSARRCIAKDARDTTAGGLVNDEDPARGVAQGMQQSVSAESQPMSPDTDGEPLV